MDSSAASRADGPASDVPDVAEEARRLIDVLRTRHLASVPTSEPLGGDECRNEAVDDPATQPRKADGDRRATDEDPPRASCPCPLCAGVAAVRSLRPETYDSLADVLDLGAGALTGLAGILRRHGSHGPNRASDPAADAGPEAPGPSHETGPHT